MREKQNLRIVSGLLAVSMMLSVFPTAAFAAKALPETAYSSETSLESENGDEKIPLTFDETGKPIGKGSRASGWRYEWGQLYFEEGYTFDQNQVVTCEVCNNGTIASGIFLEGVTNYGTITGGVFKKFNVLYGGSLPSNNYKLTVGNGMIDGVIESTAYIVGENQRVTVNFLAPNDFESWQENGAVQIANKTSTTIEFTMPAQDVVLKANYKENPLEIGADGNPTHAGGRNWEY